MQVDLLLFIPRGPTHPPRIVGYAHVSLPALGLNIYDVKLMRRADRAYAHFPERPLHQGHSLVLDEYGSLIFRRTLRFHDNEKFFEFSDAVVAAVRAAHPEAFEDTPTDIPTSDAGTHEGLNK